MTQRERERALVANASMGRMESGRIQRTTSLPASLGGGGVPWGPSMVRIVGRGPQQGTPPSTSPATKHIFCLFLESPDVTLGQKTTRTQEMRSLSFALMPLSNQLIIKIFSYIPFCDRQHIIQARTSYTMGCVCTFRNTTTTT